MSSRSNASTAKRAARPAPKLMRAAPPEDEMHCAFRPAAGGGRVCGEVCWNVMVYVQHFMDVHMKDPAARSDAKSLLSYGFHPDQLIVLVPYFASQGIPPADAEPVIKAEPN